MSAARLRGARAQVLRRAPPSVKKPSAALLRFFAVYLSRYMPRHFHALRLAHRERWPSGSRPLLVCVNHPSWWDPMVCLQLSFFLERAAEHYAPIDAAALEHYGLLRGIGLFPVEQGSLRGTKQFLRSAFEIFARPGAVLWMTPQGGFVDVRVRPTVFRSGLDALLRRMEQVTVLPLALEYTFWDERLPEALGMLGEPMVFDRGVLQGSPAATTAGDAVAASLVQTQDALAAFSLRRDPSDFTAIFAGRQGTGGVYGVWQRIRSVIRGGGLHPEHGSLKEPGSESPGGRER
jgi:1-acyl-sn-glycerol-3-phosphate acyltransferase